MSSWSPNSQGLRGVMELLELAQNCSQENHNMLYQRLKEYETHQEFAAYLCHIFIVENVSFFVKQQAGLLLKNQIKRVWVNTPQPVRQYIQNQVPNALAHDQLHIRKYGAASIGMILFRGGIDCWPSLIPSLLSVLQTENLAAVHGSLLCLEGLCQGQQCRIEEERDGETFTDTCNFICKDPKAGHIVQVCIKYAQADASELRRLSMICLLCLGQHRAQAFEQNVEEYVNVLYKLAEDETPAIRMHTCRSFIMLLNYHYEQIHPNIEEIVKFMIICLSDDNSSDEIKMEAAEFWSHWATHDNIDPRVLEPYLPKLIELLLKGMVFSDEELVELQSENDDFAQDDRPDDVNPAFSKHEKDTQKQPEGVDEQFVHTVRRSTARALDHLAIRYKDTILRILLPMLENQMNHKEWRMRESAILALGAIAPGCFREIDPYLNSIMPYLCQRIEDEVFLIRCISCWTLSRFIGWFTRDPDDNKVLVPLLEKLLKNLVLDPSKRVQQAAISCVASLLEHSQARLLPYIDPVSQQLSICLQRYKLKNLPFLFDCLLVLLMNFHTELLKNPDNLEQMIDNAVRRMLCLDDSQPAVFCVLEFVTTAASFVGPMFHRWASLTWDRAIKMCKYYLEQLDIAERHKNANQDYALPRIELFTCSLETLTGIVESLGKDSEQYMNKEELLKIIQLGLKSRNPNCRRVVFGLLSVLVDPLAHIFEKHLEDILQIALDSANLTPHNEQLFMNSSYFIGQAIKANPNVLNSHLATAIENFAAILKMPVPPQMHVPFGGTQIGPSFLTFTSAAFTFSRIANHYEKEIAHVFDEIAIEWTYHLGRAPEDEEKMMAFGVLFRQLQQNPNPFLTSPVGISILCDAIGSWWETPHDLQQTFSKVVSSFKQAVVQNGGNWEQHMAQMNEDLVDSFRRKYNC